MLTPEKRKTNKMRYEINLSRILPITNPIEISANIHHFFVSIHCWHSSQDPVIMNFRKADNFLEFNEVGHFEVINYKQVGNKKT